MTRICEGIFEDEKICSSWNGIRRLRCVRAGVITSDEEMCWR